MAGILDLLNSDLGKSIVSGVAESTGQDTNKTNSVLTVALPVLLIGMQRNSVTPEGAKGLMGALNKHDGSILDNLGDLFKGGVNADVLKDGSNILNHVLGAKQQGVEQVIGQKTGVSSDAISSILKTAAPLLMGVLGKQSRQNNTDNSNGIAGMIGGLLGGNSTDKEQNFLEQILDADGDGSIVDDVAGMILGGANQKSGAAGMLGGLLGGIFGKK